jgi:hypothetical protein
MKVILKRNMTSAKFNVKFPKGIALEYSKSLEAVEHPTTKNVWLGVKEKDFKQFTVKDLINKHIRRAVPEFIRHIEKKFPDQNTVIDPDTEYALFKK